MRTVLSTLLALFVLLYVSLSPDLTREAEEAAAKYGGGKGREEGSFGTFRKDTTATQSSFDLLLGTVHGLVVSTPLTTYPVDAVSSSIATPSLDAFVEPSAASVSDQSFPSPGRLPLAVVSSSVLYGSSRFWRSRSSVKQSL